MHIQGRRVRYGRHRCDMRKCVVQGPFPFPKGDAGAANVHMRGCPSLPWCLAIPASGGTTPALGYPLAALSPRRARGCSVTASPSVD
jgi:hypothetical protein